MNLKRNKKTINFIYLCILFELLKPQLIFKLKNSYETVKMSDMCPNNRTEKLSASLFLLYLIQGYKKRIQSSIILNDMIHPWIYILINVTRRRNRTQAIFFILCLGLSSDTTKNTSHWQYLFTAKDNAKSPEIKY